MFFRPGTKRLCATTIGQHHVAAFIVRLRHKCVPSAIIWRVWTIVVATFQRQPFWTFTKTRKKAFEGSKFWRYSDATCAVLVVPARAWIQAALNHAAPDVILLRIRATMCSIQQVRVASNHAAAGSCVAPSKNMVRERDGSTAVTAATPPSWRVGHETFNVETAEDGTERDVNWCWHVYECNESLG